MDPHLRSKEHKFVTLKVYNEVAIELCMACLKYIKKTQKPTEEILYRWTTAAADDQWWCFCQLPIFIYSGVSKVSSNSPWSWKAICSPALQWFSAIWMLRLVPISQSPKKSINILHILYSYQPCFHLQVPGHSERIDQLWVQLRQQLINNSEEI